MSQKLGISAQAYQEWDFIMQHSGASIDGLTTGMKTLATAAQSGSETLQKTLGKTEEELKAMSQEDLFSATITALQSMEEGTERTALATTLLGKSAVELAPLLNTSAEETQAMRDQVNELGGVMSDEAVKASAAFEDSLQNLKTGISGAKNTILGELLPSMVTVMDGLTKLFAGNSSEGLAVISEGLDNFIQTMGEKVPEFLRKGGQIVAAIAQGIIENLPNIIESGATMLANLLVNMGEHLPEFASWAVSLIGQIAGAILRSAPTLIAAALTLIGELAAGISQALIDVGTAIVHGIWQGMRNRKDWLFNQVKGLFSGVVNTVKNVLGIHSPSKVFAQIGGYMAEGLGEGWSDEYSAVKKTITSGLDFTGSATANRGAGIGAGITINLGGVTFNGYTSAQGEDLVRDLNRQLGRLYV